MQVATIKSLLDEAGTFGRHQPAGVELKVVGDTSVHAFELPACKSGQSVCTPAFARFEHLLRPPVLALRHRLRNTTQAPPTLCSLVQMPLASPRESAPILTA